MKYRVTIVRMEEKEEKAFPNDSGKRYQYLNVKVPLVNSNFKSLSSSDKEKFIKGFLNRIVRSDIKSDKPLKKEERIIVNPDGDYGLSSTVFDGEVKMPGHLVAKENKEQGKGRGIFG